jgi:hypothetical protein
MDKKVEMIQAETAKDFALEYEKVASNTFFIGFLKDVGKYVVGVRFLEGLYGYAGKSCIEKGQFSKQIFEDNDSEFLDNFDLYTLYVLEDTEKVELVVVGDIVDYENDDEFGTRFTINFTEQTVSEEVLSVTDAKRYLKEILHPRKEEGIIKLH